jgi:hypothetical protein
VKAGAALLLAVVCVTPAAAWATTPAEYHAGIQEAAQLVKRALAGDRAAAQRAITVLETLPGEAQRPVIDDLKAQPPALVDASTRLAALDQAGVEARAPGGSGQDGKLREILADPRYRETGPSLLDQFFSLIGRLAAYLIQLALGHGGGEAVALLIELAVAAAVIIAVVAFFARVVLRRRSGRAATGRGTSRERERADAFLEADRLAAVGDFVGALRALTAGVALALGGEHAWDASPLTIRELFVRMSLGESLRPLLLPFEATAYGGRVLNADIYAGAAAAAQPFRTLPA